MTERKTMKLPQWVIDYPEGTRRVERLMEEQSKKLTPEEIARMRAEADEEARQRREAREAEKARLKAAGLWPPKE